MVREEKTKPKKPKAVLSHALGLVARVLRRKKTRASWFPFRLCGGTASRLLLSASRLVCRDQLIIGEDFSELCRFID